MRTPLRPWLAAIAVALLCATAWSATAQASRISLSRQTIGVSGRLTINAAIVCNVLWTIQTTAPTITKVVAAGWGILRAPSTIGGCIGGGATGAGSFLLDTALGYHSFQGGLPAITNILVLAGGPGFDFGMLLNLAVGSCLYGTAGARAPLGPIDIQRNAGSGALIAVDFAPSAAVAKVIGPAMCPPTATIRGSLTTFLAPGAPTATLV